jgi:DNA-binding SARP family transcriptional activator
MRRPGNIKLELLGGFAINVAGNPPTPIWISSKKGRALLAYLAMHPQHSGGREQLATLLWGDRLDKQARQSLRQCLRWLRRELARTEPALLYSDGDKIGLQTQFLTVDADEFAALARSAESSELERAADLYRGEFLAGCDLDMEAFADWVRAERSRLQAMAAQVFVQCAERCSGRSSLSANHTTSFLPVAGFGSGAYSAKLFAGTRHRLSAFSQPQNLSGSGLTSFC